MVWGMSIPSAFGKFWPDGEFEYDAKARESGWSDRLRLHYLAQTPEEQRRLFDYGDNSVGYGAGNYQTYAIGKFANEIGKTDIMFRELPPYSPINPHEPPKSFKAEKTYNELGSLIALNYGILAVEHQLKKIIDRLDPGMHQFFPIDISMPKGAIFPAEYYILVVGRYFYSFLPDNSKEGSFTSGGGYYGFRDKKDSISGLSFSRDVLGKSHLWRERRFSSKLTCLSDELESEIIKAGLSLPKHFKMMEG